MIKRILADYAQNIAHHYPVVTIIGPRQSRKTTPARSVFSYKPYANLEHPVTRSFASEDPTAFLTQYPEGAVFDEIQRVLELLSYIWVTRLSPLKSKPAKPLLQIISRNCSCFIIWDSPASNKVLLFMPAMLNKIDMKEP